MSDELDELRELLLGADRLAIARLEARIDALEHRLEAEQRTEELAALLPKVIERRSTDGSLDPGLQPTVERTLLRSVEDDPKVIADAIYPVIGPAIRRSIASMFSFGPTGGFQVDHIFIIEGATSVPLVHHQRSDQLDEGAVEMVSGMLSAIRSFVEESFEAGQLDGLQDLRVGDVTVLVEPGPRAVIAAVTAGAPPTRFREQLQIALEDFHREHDPDLRTFDGAVEPYQPFEPRLAELERRHGLARGNRFSVLLLFLLLIIIVVVGAAIIL